MSKFSRSNVSDAAFSKGSVDRSSYDKSENTTITPILGAFHPVRCVRLMPNTTLQGSVNPRLQLEKVISPQIGRTRLDVHTFSVPFRRICNDFKIGLEKQNFSDGELLTLGMFDMYELFDVLFSSLFFYRPYNGQLLSSQLTLGVPTSVYERVKANMAKSGLPELPVWDSVSGVDDMVFSSYASYYYNLTTGIYFDHLVNSALDHIMSIYAFYAFDDNENDLLNYPKDFYAQEYLRLSEVRGRGYDYYRLIVSILEPYVGINSNADMLGYPILRDYGSLQSLIVDLPYVLVNLEAAESSGVNLYVDFDASSLSDVEINGIIEYLFLLSVFTKPFIRTFVIRDYYPESTLPPQILFTGSVSSFKLYPGILNDWHESGVEQFIDFQKSLPYRQYSDFPLRAAYACWFDRMRDWHIENRSKCLDPDTFSHQSLFARLLFHGTYYHGHFISDVNYVAVRTIPYALLVPRQRFYADDSLTTIKTDDKFRHVYSPIMQLDDVAGAVDTRSDDVLNNIERIYLDSLAIAFPSGSLFGNIKSDSNLQALRNDLCLAKRAHMLERWLARNYFTPDNYNGFISAHFDTDVSDMDMLISKYIGGSEQLVSGEQQVADISTSETERGTRTFSGGVSSSAEFSIKVTDYSYLVSFVSLVPLVEYDSLSPAVLETNFNELPSPEYANDTRIEARLSDFVRDFALNHDIIGYVPRYYLDRTCLDSVHGRYLTDYRSYSWFRDWFNMTFVSGSKFGSHGFSLTPYSLRVHLPLDSFLGLAPWDSVAFGEISMPLSINVPLSAAIEII